MIPNICKLQNLSIYRNYSSNDELEEFKRFNLFYGWNGSGKSTLSRIFRILEKRQYTEELPVDTIFKLNLMKDS